MKFMSLLVTFKDLVPLVGRSEYWDAVVQTLSIMSGLLVAATTSTSFKCSTPSISVSSCANTRSATVEPSLCRRRGSTEEGEHRGGRAQRRGSTEEGGHRGGRQEGREKGEEGREEGEVKE